MTRHVTPVGARPETLHRGARTATVAAVLHLDELAERRVRQAWRALDEHGVPSAGATSEDGFRPHITLAIVDSADPRALLARLRGPLTDVVGLPLTLSSLGFFLTDKAPAYLSVAPTRRLLQVHEKVHRAIGTAAGSWPYYRPGTWVPHCTLAMGATCQTAVAEALGRWTLPIRATVDSALVTELPPAATSHRRTLGDPRRGPAAPSRSGASSARG